MSEFMTRPSRTDFASTQSSGFVGAKPSNVSIGDYIAEPLGKSLAAIGLHEAGFGGERENTPQAQRARQELSENAKKDAAREQIGALAGTVNKDNALDTYFTAKQLGARAGLANDEVDVLFRGAAASRGADNVTLGRIGDRGGYSDGTVFTPEAAASGLATARGNTLADHAAEIAERQRQEGVAAGQEDKKFGQQKALEQLKSDLEKSRAVPKAPGVAIPELDSLRKTIVQTLSDTTNTLPTKEGDFASAVKVDPGLVNEIATRASELTSSPYSLSPIDAINRAIKEKSEAGPAQDTGPRLDLTGIGLGTYGKTSGPAVTRKQNDDPLGLR